MNLLTDARHTDAAAAAAAPAADNDRLLQRSLDENE